LPSISASAVSFYNGIQPGCQVTVIGHNFQATLPQPSLVHVLDGSGNPTSVTTEVAPQPDASGDIVMTTDITSGYTGPGRVTVDPLVVGVQASANLNLCGAPGMHSVVPPSPTPTSPGTGATGSGGGGFPTGGAAGGSSGGVPRVHVAE
jgi:hypothetical protein